MTELDFLHHWCHLTDMQIAVVYAKLVDIKKQQTGKTKFIGAARPIGQMQFMPCFELGGMLNVIDECGYYQLASKIGVIWYDRG